MFRLKRKSAGAAVVPPRGIGVKPTAISGNIISRYPPSLYLPIFLVIPLHISSIKTHSQEEYLAFQRHNAPSRPQHPQMVPTPALYTPLYPYPSPASPKPSSCHHPNTNLPRLEANSHLLQPPVNNYCVYHPSSPATSGYTVMIVGGPNARTDYHINSTPEFFYQYRGSMLLRTVDRSVSPPAFQDIPIHEGSLFLLPANTPHCPVRFADTVGVVMEVPRAPDATDTMLWFCPNSACKQVVWEKRFVCTDLGTQVKEVVEEFSADLAKRTCAACGTVAESRYKEGELTQPPRFPPE